MGESGRARPLSQAQSKAETKQALRAAGVRSIDIHAHYYPQSFIDVLNTDGKRFNAEFRMTGQFFSLKAPGGTASPLSIKFIDLKQRIADMDQQGVTMQAISLSTPMNNWGDEAISHKMAQVWNDAASAAHKAYPDRLVVLMALPMLYPDRALDELNRASKLPGVRGVYMGTNIDSHDLDDPLFERVYERIEALGLPIFLHPITTVGGKRTQPWYLSNLLGNPVDTAIAACHLIFGGVLDRHPKLQFTLPHGGGVLPILIGRIDHGAEVRAEIQALHMTMAPSAYLQRFHYDTIVHSKPIMEFVIREVGAERVMLGSDYCFDMGYERPVGFLEQIDLPSAERKMVPGGNAARLLKL
jgi:aminocarboxymuconate-semialdehyde decarboxylase